MLLLPSTDLRQGHRRRLDAALTRLQPYPQAKAAVDRLVEAAAHTLLDDDPTICLPGPSEGLGRSDAPPPTT